MREIPKVLHSFIEEIYSLTKPAVKEEFPEEVIQHPQLYPENSIQLVDLITAPQKYISLNYPWHLVLMYIHTW